MGRYNKINEKIVGELKEIVGQGYVFTDKFDLEPYSHDETEDLSFYPEVVVKPQTTEQVSAVLKLCNDNRIPVTPRGGGTGLSGGALAVYGGVVLSLERMNRIIEIDVDNMMATVEAGVITCVFQEELEKMGLFYPVDPASSDSCLMGGNVAENSGGPRAVKYGVTKDYVYGLKAVLPDGRIFSGGGKLFKNVSGYNLTQLLVGSEGTLAVVTEIIIKILPQPEYRQTMLVPFDSLGDAARTLTKIFTARIIPSAAEFMEKSAIKAAEDKHQKKFPYSDSEALLLIEIDGNYSDVLEKQAEKIGEICLEGGAVDVFIADNPEKQAFLWEMRKIIGEAVKDIAPYKEEDTVVPRSNLPALVEKIKEISRKYNITTVSYGHAGDGNIHCNIIKKDISEERWQKELPIVITELFTEVVKLGGTISGEHGIGWVQKRYLPLALSETELELMRKIKKVFDPNDILNPGKLLPEVNHT
jgi:glycolate oxidase